MALGLDFQLAILAANQTNHVTLPSGGSEARRRGGLYFWGEITTFLWSSKPSSPLRPRLSQRESGIIGPVYADVLLAAAAAAAALASSANSSCSVRLATR